MSSAPDVLDFDYSMLLGCHDLVAIGLNVGYVLKVLDLGKRLKGPRVHQIEIATLASHGQEVFAGSVGSHGEHTARRLDAACVGLMLI